MIITLLFTVVVEGAVVLGYSAWRNKPRKSLVLTSLLGNVLTQFMLWIVLMISFRSYLPTLAIAEILIWGMEGLLLFSIPTNQLNIREAFLLSLGMNLISLALGWFLPV